MKTTLAVLFSFSFATFNSFAQEDTPKNMDLYTAGVCSAFISLLQGGQKEDSPAVRSIIMGSIDIYKIKSFEQFFNMCRENHYKVDNVDWDKIAN